MVSQSVKIIKSLIERFLERDNIQRGFPKTSVFGKTTLYLWEKVDLKPLFPGACPKSQLVLRPGSRVSFFSTGTVSLNIRPFNNAGTGFSTLP
jgi:hypothetical protein